MESISFQLLEKVVADFAKENQDSGPGQLERWTFVLGALAGGAGGLAGTLIGDVNGLRVVQAGLGMEILLLGISCVCMARREWRMFRQPYEWFSAELEHGYGEYRGLVTQLLSHPVSDLKRRLRYIKGRKASMSYRFGLFSGGAMERLGVLPILGVLYLQFKDWEFGDWQSLGKVHLVGGLLLWGLLLVYLISWHLVRLKLRVDGYEALLEEVVLTHEEKDHPETDDGCARMPRSTSSASNAAYVG